MKTQSLQEKLSEISSYSQINKAFRHAYGASAAAVLSTLLYKYDYWESKGKLKKIRTKKGDIYETFYISKLDISFDSGVSISMLEKKDKKNPIILLQKLKFINRLKRTKNYKADSFIVYPDPIISEIKKLTKYYKNDQERMNNLTQTDRRKFLKALNGKLTREEVYEKFDDFFEEEELENEDEGIHKSPTEENISPIEKIKLSNEQLTSPIEGELKYITNTLTKRAPKNTESRPSSKGEEKRKLQFKKTANEIDITIKMVGKGISAFVSNNITSKQMFEILKNYIPNNLGSKWKMNEKDESYIKYNLNGVDAEYMKATLIYIESNVKKMINGERKMRFGSMLAGIKERIIEAGIGEEDLRPKMTEEEYKKMLANMPEEENIGFEGYL